MDKAIKVPTEPNETVLVAIYMHKCEKCLSENVKLDMNEEQLEQDDRLEVVLSYECQTCGYKGVTTI